MMYPSFITPPPPKDKPYDLGKLSDERLARLRALRPDLRREIDATFASRAGVDRWWFDHSLSWKITGLEDQ